jgi:hypothetical protein
MVKQAGADVVFAADLGGTFTTQQFLDYLALEF